MIQQLKNYMYNHEYNHFNNILQYEHLFFWNQKIFYTFLQKPTDFSLI